MSIATALRMPWGMKVEAKRAILTLWLKRFVSNNTCVNRIRTTYYVSIDTQTITNLLHIYFKYCTICI